MGRERPLPRYGGAVGLMCRVLEVRVASDFLRSTHARAEFGDQYARPRARNGLLRDPSDETEQLPHYRTPQARVRARDGVLEQEVGCRFFAGYHARERDAGFCHALKDRPVCGARTRKGTSCRMRADHPGKRRCKFHGGRSTGPRTEAGRARIAEAQRRRWAKFREEIKSSENKEISDLTRLSPSGNQDARP